MTDQQEIIDAIALTRCCFFHPTGLIALYRQLGSAHAIMSHRNHIREVLPEVSPRWEEAFRDMSDAMRCAEAEYAWAEAHQVAILSMSDDRYPQRLRDCPDAPLVLYYKGTASLNQAKVINMVGTRHCTPYGTDLIRKFIIELRQACPQVLIVSGLAYGIDICAHQQALQQGYETVGVLAHGLDTLYPSLHRPVAEKMLAQGGLLTEYTTATKIDKLHFVRRNRIVAGMCDATILVESGIKGGGLITCSIAQDYHRDVFAFPGAVGAPYSAGCNNLIRDNGAALITGAEDFIQAMGWTDDEERQAARQQGIERQLFPELTPEEELIVTALRSHSDLPVNVLTVRTGIPIPRLSALLFTLEMKGVIRSLAGGLQHLIG